MLNCLVNEKDKFYIIFVILSMSFKKINFDFTIKSQIFTCIIYSQPNHNLIKSNAYNLHVLAK